MANFVSLSISVLLDNATRPSLPDSIWLVPGLGGPSVGLRCWLYVKRYQY